MSGEFVVKEPIEEDVDPYFYRRVTDGIGNTLVIGDVIASGVKLTVYDMSGNDPGFVVHTEQLDPATSYPSGAGGRPLMYTILQYTGWTKDNIGYNFFHRPRVALITNPSGVTGTIGGHVYRWEYELTLSAALGSGKAWVIFETPIVAVQSS